MSRRCTFFTPTSILELALVFCSKMQDEKCQNLLNIQRCFTGKRIYLYLQICLSPLEDKIILESLIQYLNYFSLVTECTFVVGFTIKRLIYLCFQKQIFGHVLRLVVMQQQENDKVLFCQAFLDGGTRNICCCLILHCFICSDT